MGPAYFPSLALASHRFWAPTSSWLRLSPNSLLSWLASAHSSGLALHAFPTQEGLPRSHTPGQAYPAFPPLPELSLTPRHTPALIAWAKHTCLLSTPTPTRRPPPLRPWSQSRRWGNEMLGRAWQAGDLRDRKSKGVRLLGCPKTGLSEPSQCLESRT